jgi:hypothetical protein
VEAITENGNFEYIYILFFETGMEGRRSRGMPKE